MLTLAVIFRHPASSVSVRNVRYHAGIALEQPQVRRRDVKRTASGSESCLRLRQHHSGFQARCVVSVSARETTSEVRLTSH